MRNYCSFAQHHRFASDVSLCSYLFRAKGRIVASGGSNCYPYPSARAFHQLLIIDKGEEAIVILPSKMFASRQHKKWADKYLIYEFSSFSILNCYNKHFCTVHAILSRYVCKKSRAQVSSFNIITANMKRVNRRQ